MRTIPLGDAGLTVSPFCLGTMDMGTGLDQAGSSALLDAFTAAGGNFIDTANIYTWWVPGGAAGISERMIGTWMRERRNRDRLVIATKVGFGVPGGVAEGLRAATIIAECEKSLRFLGTEVIDLFYAHQDHRASPLEETLEAFDRLVRQGKVRAVGASNYTAWRLEQCRQTSRRHGWAGFCCLQQRHSYLRPLPGTGMGGQRFATEEVLDYCRAERFPILAYTPLLGGCYVRDDRRLPPQYQGPDNERRLATVRAVAQDLGVTANQVVLAWMMQGDPRVIPVVATTRQEHLREILAAESVTLSAEVLKRLDEAGLCNEKGLVLIGS